MAGLSGYLVPLGFGVAASLATMIGGMLALRLTERVSALLAVAAGIVLGVALLDLLPEALEHGADRYGYRAVLTFAAAGMVGYLLLGRLLAGGGKHAPWHAHLGPASLTLHSFVDGLGMGLAFQIAPQVGWTVAFAVLTHDVADGLNTVSLALAATRRQTARNWLLVNGAAPLLGVVTGLLVAIPHAALAPVLAVVGGAFLYIGAVELVPRSLARDPRVRTTLFVVAGFALMLLVSNVARH